MNTDFPRLESILILLGKTRDPKKSRTFTRSEFETFLLKAPNTPKNLMLKVVASLGIYGALRRAELSDMKTTDVKIYDDHMLVHVPPKKTFKKRSFVLPTHSNIQLCPVHYFNLYMDLRKNKDHPRLFIRITTKKNGTDSIYNQPIGINTIGSYPQEIAKYLNLPDSHLYTGHTFRRTAATIVAEEGGSLVQIKRLGGWTGNTVVEGYIDSTTRSQIQVANLISKDTGRQIENPITQSLKTKTTEKKNSKNREVEELERLLTPQDFEYAIDKMIYTNTLSIDTSNASSPLRTSRKTNESPHINRLFDISASTQDQDQNTQNHTESFLCSDDYEVIDTSFNPEPYKNKLNSHFFEDSISLTPLSSPTQRCNITLPLSPHKSPLKSLQTTPTMSPAMSPQMSPAMSPDISPDMSLAMSPAMRPSYTFSPTRMSNKDLVRSYDQTQSKPTNKHKPDNNTKTEEKTKAFNIKKCTNFTFNIYNTPM